MHPPDRRRSSAASSRRNSLSSTHSHHSHTSSCSFSGRTASNHVAQHLRRASIIESRKARLADRAAYAEQVRQRAALAKSLPRGANLEEKAMAAQVAREKYLAGVAAACAEEVRRAKKIAEEIKEKRRADNLKLRLDMQEKLAEAERRRNEYQNTRRLFGSTAHSLESLRPRSRGGPNSELRAVQHIQSAWRTRLRRRTIENFLKLGLKADEAEQAERTEEAEQELFELVTAKIENDHVILQTTKLLELFGLFDKDNTREEPSPTKLLLSAFLILSAPRTCLVRGGSDEVELKAKAKHLMASLDGCLSKLGMSRQFLPTEEEKQVLKESFYTFRDDFILWKIEDSKFLVQKMVKSYVELDILKRAMQNEPEDILRKDFEEGIMRQQISLIVRIKRLAGRENALKLIGQALKKDRRSKSAKNLKATRPRTVSLPSPFVGSSDESKAPNPPASNFDDGLYHHLIQKSNLPVHAAFKHLSPLPDNRTLVHEIAVNKDFNLESLMLAGLQDRQAFFVSLCKLMEEELAKGNGDAWIIAIVTNVRYRLLSLLPPTSSLRTPIEEVLDATVIENQVKMGTFSYERFFSFMNDMLPRMCAPARDEQVRNLVEDKSSSYMQRLGRVLFLIDSTCLDYAQFEIMRNAPVLLKEAPGYEQRRFAKDLDDGIHTIEKTQRWWQTARADMLSEIKERDPENINHPASRPTSEQVYLKGLSEMIFLSELDIEDVPETLELDKHRLRSLRTSVFELIAAGGIILTAKNFLRQEIRTLWNTEALKIFELTQNACSTTQSSSSKPDLSAVTQEILSVISTSHSMSAEIQSQMCSFVTRALAQASRRQFTDPVLRLLFRRLRTHIGARVQTTNTAKRVQLASSAAESLAKAGLPEFVVEIREIAECLMRIGALDRAAHGQWYEEIAAKINAEQKE